MSPALRRFRLLGALTLTGLVVAMASSANGAPGFETSVPCGGQNGGAKALVAAIQKANARGGGRIQLAHGCTYALSKGNFDSGQGPAGLPQIASPVTIDGRGASIVRAKGSPEFRFFEIESSGSASLAITQVTLRNGNIGRAGDNNTGGAILVDRQGALTVRGSTLASNTAVNGGAISAGGASVKVINSTVRGNSATLVDGSGGGVYSINGRLRVDSSVIRGNKSSGGGGGISGQSVGGQASLVRITDTSVTGNVSEIENGGGGVFTFGPATLVIRRSTIAGNTFGGVGSAGGGGGIANEGTMTMTNSTVSGNVAGARDNAEGAPGGGIFNTVGGTGTVTASTIAGNRVLGPGASGGGIAAAAELNVAATIVAGNRSRDCVGSVGDGGFNLEDGPSCGFNKHAVDANPRLIPLADNGGGTETMALRRRSPAINRVWARRPACGGTVDQRGVPRPQRRRCDIGAFESVATRTSLRITRRAKHAKRVRLTAKITPRVWVPGPPEGNIIFRDRGKILGKGRLDGDRPDKASLRVRLGGGKHRLRAAYKGSRLFLRSRSSLRHGA